MFQQMLFTSWKAHIKYSTVYHSVLTPCTYRNTIREEIFEEIWILL